MPFTALPVFAFLAAATAGFAAEPNDWINVNYILQQAGGGSSFTSFSQKTIISKAGSTAKDGPWTIMSKTGVKPPSGDVHDYLSWAPYHWPDCNWCTKGTKQIANPNATSGEPDDGAGDVPEEDAPDDSAHEESLDFGEIFSDYFIDTQQNVARTDHRMRRVKRATSIHYGPRDVDLPLPIIDDPPPPEPALTQPFAVPTSQPTQSTTRTNKPVAGTPSPAQAAAKGKEKDTKAACTPSPTKSLAPSATWTTCPYVVRDGKVNPDVRTLPGSSAAQDMPESVLFNALTYAFSKSGTNSQNVGKFVDAFFLTSSTAMHPNLNFGQLVRGPGKDHQIGTFTGPLDMRGLVKVVNAIQLMKALKSPDWTSAAGKQKRAIDGNEDVPIPSANDTSKAAGDTMASETKIIPFECPDVFSDAKKVEIEDGLFVTCDKLAPYYKLPALSDI